VQPDVPQQPRRADAGNGKPDLSAADQAGETISGSAAGKLPGCSAAVKSPGEW